MIIDLDNIENLKLQSSKITFIQGLDYFSKITNENLNNVFYNLTRSSTLKDIDIKFIIAFLSKTKYIDLKDGRVNKRIKIDSNRLIEDFIFFYYSILINNIQLNESLFINSEFAIKNDEILINIFSVQIKHRIFFTVLQNLGLLTKTDERGLVIIKNYTLAKKFLERPLRKISPKELEIELEQKRINGLIAEKFVLDYEKKRLGRLNIDWVAEYIVNEGYDIASFDNYDDIVYNRFIEVKSYQGKTPNFYWSNNELKVASYKQEKYWIYLVNRDSINDKNYIPVMIQNPFINILDNDNWIKETDKLKITANFNV